MGSCCWSDYYKYLIEIFARIKTKPRIVEEHDGFSGLITAIEAGAGVALVGESFGVTAGSRVKILRLTPEPEPTIIGIAAPKGKLHPRPPKSFGSAQSAWLPARAKRVHQGTGAGRIPALAERGEEE